MAKELAQYLRGWIGYFGKCETPSVLKSLEEWIRRRLRSVIWKQWKRRTVRFAELRKRDVNPLLAAKTAGSTHRPWRTGEQSGPGVCAAQCLLRLARGSEIDWRPIAQPAEPPYADPHVRWCGLSITHNSGRCHYPFLKMAMLVAMIFCIRDLARA
jgi:hypothetical protein